MHAPVGGAHRCARRYSDGPLKRKGATEAGEEGCPNAATATARRSRTWASSGGRSIGTSGRGYRCRRRAGRASSSSALISIVPGRHIAPQEVMGAVRNEEVSMSQSSPEKRSRATGERTPRPESVTLTPAEIVEITGYRRGHEQLGWFRSLGVPAKRRPDGSVSVAREHYFALGRARDPSIARVESLPRLKLE